MKRRKFLSSAALAAGGMALGDLESRASGADSLSQRDKPRAKVERAGVGTVGLRYQGSVITEKARQYGDIVALADVDRHVLEQARASFGSTPKIYEDYQDLLTNPSVDVVLIGSPDHWHAKMLIDAVRAGKDVYCEKPLTLTIDEGKQIRDVVNGSSQIVQVGTWQRSDRRFRTAVEMVRAGRIGNLQRVICTTDKNPNGGPFEERSVPGHLNWNLWLGPAPRVSYVPERCHYTFRWWLDYAGGKMTDWGAHHIDIAQWAIDSQPVRIDGTATFPGIEGGYTVPTDFRADIEFENGVELLVRDEGRRGIMFQGDLGRIFVNRSTLAGKPVEELKKNPLSRDEMDAYDFDNLQRPERQGKLDAIVNHMGNFFDCIDARRQPISDVESQHRSATTCHLANLSMRLGRALKWNAVTETFVGDSEANSMLSRSARTGFEITS